MAQSSDEFRNNHGGDDVSLTPRVSFITVSRRASEACIEGIGWLENEYRVPRTRRAARAVNHTLRLPRASLHVTDGGTLCAKAIFSLISTMCIERTFRATVSQDESLQVGSAEDHQRTEASVKLRAAIALE